MRLATSMAATFNLIGWALIFSGYFSKSGIVMEFGVGFSVGGAFFYVSALALHNLLGANDDND